MAWRAGLDWGLDWGFDWRLGLARRHRSRSELRVLHIPATRLLDRIASLVDRELAADGVSGIDAEAIGEFEGQNQDIGDLGVDLGADLGTVDDLLRVLFADPAKMGEQLTGLNRDRRGKILRGVELLPVAGFDEGPDLILQFAKSRLLHGGASVLERLVRASSASVRSMVHQGFMIGMQPASSSFVPRRELIELEAWLWEQAFDRRFTVEEVAEWVADLSDLYTVERGVLVREQGSRQHLLAKSLYFLAADAPKVTIALAECRARSDHFTGIQRVVDIGCGVGATSVGALLALATGGGQDGPIELVGIDREPSVLTIWARTIARMAAILGLDAAITTRVGDLHSAASIAGRLRASDLILCQTALNELLAGSHASNTELHHDPETVDLVASWGRAAPTLIIEPALRTTTRALQRMRDAMAPLDGLRIVAPCPHALVCPMLASPRDWCHESRVMHPTPQVARINAITRRRDERLLFSMLALEPTPSDDSLSSDGILWRLVSDPLGSRGKTERWVCGSDGQLRSVRVLDRERSERNAAIVEAERGTLVRLAVLPDRDRLTPTTDVRVAER
jgi:SAM-dependent methyltransferase